MGTQVADNSKKTCLGGTLLTFLFLAVGIGGPVLYMTTMSGDPEPTPPPTRAVRHNLSRFKQPDPVTCTPQTRPDAKAMGKLTAARTPNPKVQPLQPLKLKPKPKPKLKPTQ